MMPESYKLDNQTSFLACSNWLRSIGHKEKVGTSNLCQSWRESSGKPTNSRFMVDSSQLNLTTLMRGLVCSQEHFQGAREAWMVWNNPWPQSCNLYTTSGTSSYSHKSHNSHHQEHVDQFLQVWVMWIQMFVFGGLTTCDSSLILTILSSWASTVNPPCVRKNLSMLTLNPKIRNPDCIISRQKKSPFYSTQP